MVYLFRREGSARHLHHLVLEQYISSRNRRDFFDFLKKFDFLFFSTIMPQILPFSYAFSCHFFCCNLIDSSLILRKYPYRWCCRNSSEIFYFACHHWADYSSNRYEYARAGCISSREPLWKYGNCYRKCTLIKCCQCFSNTWAYCDD